MPIDNTNVAAKLDLRYYFLKKYHADNSPRVLDACQGSGILWKIIRRQFNVAHYLGLDTKEKKGRLKIDSARFLESPGWSFDVIDVDTYSNPWRHFSAILKNGNEPVTIFLTVGHNSINKSYSRVNMSNRMREVLGIKSLDIPVSILSKLIPLGISAMLSECADRVIEAIESPPSLLARYIGIRLGAKPK